jgi:hypothetical protein
MIFRRRNAGLLMLVLCGILLSTRMMGDHLHLCFDGQEPAVSLHGDDGGLHHEHVADGGAHNDRDVDLPTAASAKGKSLDSSASALLAAVASAVLVPQVRTSWTRVSSSESFQSFTRHLRPPLRGPPR